MYTKNRPKWAISYSNYISLLFLILITILILFSWLLTVIQYEESEVLGKYLTGTTAYDIRSYYTI